MHFEFLIFTTDLICSLIFIVLLLLLLLLCLVLYRRTQIYETIMIAATITASNSSPDAISNNKNPTAFKSSKVLL